MDPHSPGPILPRRIRQVLTDIAAEHNLTLAAMIEHRQFRHLVRVRRQAARRLRAMGFSYPVIGRWLGLDSSSIVHLVKRRPDDPEPADRPALIDADPEPDLWI